MKHEKLPQAGQVSYDTDLSLTIDLSEMCIELWVRLQKDVMDEEMNELRDQLQGAIS